MEISWNIEPFHFIKPFVITGHTFDTVDALQVILSNGQHSGIGESVGAYYLGEYADTMASQISEIAKTIDDSLSIESIQELLPACGVRTAIDCAYWDFICKSQNKTIWELIQLKPKKLITVFTLGIDDPELMAQQAVEASAYPHLKIKLSNDRPIERLEMIRAVRPDAKLIVDVNQGWSFAELQEYAPHCQCLDITMIEQPLARGADHDLEGYESPVPLGADESCLHMGEFNDIVKRYQVLNIKLDKCGGLTEGLKLVRAAQENNLQLMVGNMAGSSLSMAPSFVIGQYCQFVDIDGPLLLTEDVLHGLSFRDDGLVDIPSQKLWG